MSIKQIAYRFLVFIAYIFIFGAIMYAVEHNRNRERKEEKRQVLQGLWISFLAKYNMTREDFDNITHTTRHSLEQEQETWTLALAVAFAVHLCTTIGYGNLTPQTQGGQILCIFGALLGIPLALLTLNSIGTMVTNGCTKFIYQIEMRIFKHTTVQLMQVKRLVCTIILMTSMISIGAATTTSLTNWSLTESVYFWFITFSTVGFGDYVVLVDFQILENVNENAIACILIGYLVFTLFGLAVLASVINCALEVTSMAECCPGCRRRNRDRTQSANRQDGTVTPSGQ